MDALFGISYIARKGRGMARATWDAKNASKTGKRLGNMVEQEPTAPRYAPYPIITIFPVDTTHLWR